MNASGTAIKNEVIRGGVAVEKWDSEKDKREPQGTADLEGAKIQIISQNDHEVLVDGKSYTKNEVVATLTIDKNGKASTAADLLPYGNYQLKESIPPTGYTSEGTITRNFEIREDGKVVQMNTSDTAIKNEVIRGGVAVEKWLLPLPSLQNFCIWRRRIQESVSCIPPRYDIFPDFFLFLPHKIYWPSWFLHRLFFIPFLILLETEKNLKPKIMI